MMAAGDGLVSMTPSSIAHSGTSATINADGGVDFTAVTSLSLNGVFTGDYDNYLIVFGLNASAGEYLLFRMRAAGTDASGTNYTIQGLRANGGTVDADGGRFTSQTAGFAAAAYGTQRAGNQLHVYGPFLAQPTATRNVSAFDSSSAVVIDKACTHSLSTSYDGITFLSESTGTFTGNVHVFGYEE